MTRRASEKGLGVILVLGSLLLVATAQPEVLPNQDRFAREGDRVGPSETFEDCCRVITEGEFALFFVRALSLDPPSGGWSEERAVAALAHRGHAPDGGWHPRRLLTEAAMTQAVARTRFATRPAAPRVTDGRAPVTVARARAVFTGGLPITLGEVASLVAPILSRQAAAPLSPEDALALLVRRQILSPTGWNAHTIVTEKTLRTILEKAQLLSPPTTNLFEELDALPVDYSRAVALVRENKSLLTQGMVALLLVKLSGMTTPTGGWTVERAIAELERFNARPEYGWAPTAPICRGDLVRLLRRAGIAALPGDECQTVVSSAFRSSSERRPSSVAGIITGITPPALTRGPRLPTRSIFGPSEGTTLVAPIPPRAVGPPVQMPATPVPPEGIGPEIPSTFTQTPPRTIY